MEGTPHRAVGLPESVERIIRRICEKKKQPPLRTDVRGMLAEIGEQASMELLTKILSSSKTIFSFSGYVTYLVRSHYKTQAASPSSVSPYIPSHKLNGRISQSPSADFQRKVPRNICCELSFDDETQEMRSLGVGHQSSLVGELREKAESTTISPQLMVLNKLDFRKLFLVLSYIGRKKLEDVVTLEGANKICSMKDLSMELFETEMWNTYGQKFCDKSDRSQYIGWDSGKTHNYCCHVCEDGSYYFKGPYLNSTRNHLQRSLGDDKILAVKFLEEAAYVTGKIVEEGILVGPWRYRFFGTFSL